MKYPAAFIVSMTILLLPGAVGAQETTETTPVSEYTAGAEEDNFEPVGRGSRQGSAGPGTRGFGRGHRRGPGGDFRGLKIKQFRHDVRKIGDEMRQNHLLIESLKEELELIDPGVERAELKARLNGVRQRQALLKLELARKKVTFTGQARDLAESRYRESVRQLEEAEREIEEEFPGLLPPDPVPKEE